MPLEGKPQPTLADLKKFRDQEKLEQFIQDLRVIVIRAVMRSYQAIKFERYQLTQESLIFWFDGSPFVPNSDVRQDIKRRAIDFLKQHLGLKRVRVSVKKVREDEHRFSVAIDL